jgi:1,4-alpha-glucan branching enzyme
MEKLAPPLDGTALVTLDPMLTPYGGALRARYRHYQAALARLASAGGLLGPISQGYRYFGFNRGQRDGESGVWYREWAPAAQQLSLVGDFNAWNRSADPMTRDPSGGAAGSGGGVWSLFLPDSRYGDRLTHQSLLKVHVVSRQGAMDRIPAYIRRVIQDPASKDFTGQYWAPAQTYAMQHPVPQIRGGLRIYESHVGMAQEQARVGTFAEFAENILPRIAKLGYNAVQLMAVMEHPYYGSFGYHVSSFYAVSSRFGTPEDLHALIDKAHALGLVVLLDMIHSHAVTNTREGLAKFDGSDHQYFYPGARGHHDMWNSLLFDYTQPEVQRFLLSNLRYWLEEHHFDGFRFDGVTSMMYLDHGLRRVSWCYDDYFSGNVDRDAVLYLQLANQLVHTVRPGAITIAEDVSGMVGTARPVAEGGIGFDYRLAMGLPDFWIKQLKEKRDEDWNLNEAYYQMLNRRSGEKHVAYVESHDQALVGDKTMAFWLMGEEMYWHMNKASPSLIIDRGIALHKMIRLLTFSLGGEAWLCFMGNEFGHPEWVDFPREGNGFSYHYARRQWSLVDNGYLRYQGLSDFDQAMLTLAPRFALLQDPLIEQLALHEDTKQLVYRRGPLLFVFNFHPVESYTGLRIPVPDAADYRVVLDTDDKRFGGFGRVDPSVTYFRQNTPMYGRQQSIQIYIPSRSAQVLMPVTGAGPGEPRA